MRGGNEEEILYYLIVFLESFNLCLFIPSLINIRSFQNLIPQIEEPTDAQRKRIVIKKPKR